MKQLLAILLVCLAVSACSNSDFAEDIGRMDSDMIGATPFLNFVIEKYGKSGADAATSGDIDFLFKNLKTIDCSGQGLAVLSGLEYFEALDTLICKDNLIYNMGLIPESLEYLDCSGNLIEELNVSKTEISTLYCNPMNSPLDGKNLLKYLYVRRGQVIENITEGRKDATQKRIPDETVIIAIPVF